MEITIFLEVEVGDLQLLMLVSQRVKGALLTLELFVFAGKLSFQLLDLLLEALYLGRISTATPASLRWHYAHSLAR